VSLCVLNSSSFSDEIKVMTSMDIACKNIYKTSIERIREKISMPHIVNYALDNVHKVLGRESAAQKCLVSSPSPLLASFASE
jgi:hypothetical protein